MASAISCGDAFQNLIMPSVWKKNNNNTSFGLFQTCCSFISELQTFLTALAACPSLELLLPRIRKESFFANKPAPAPLPRKKLWLRGKSLAQQISLLIDNGASVLPTQREKKNNKKGGYLILLCLCMIQERGHCSRYSCTRTLHTWQSTKRGARSRECHLCSAEVAARIL